MSQEGILTARGKRLLWRSVGVPANHAVQMLWSGYEYAAQFARSYVVEEICPYCIEKFSLRKSEFRCDNDKCKLIPDQILADKWEITAPQRPVVPSPGRFVRSVTCLECDNPTIRRLCPNCHSDLPSTFGAHKNIMIAVVGSRESGKTHYIAVLVDVIKKIAGENFDMALFERDDVTIRRYRDEFYSPLFRGRKQLNATAPSRVNIDVRRPLVFCLQNTRKGLLAGIAGRSVTLAFFDTAGENLDSEDIASIYNKYIYRSDGIILLVDPLQFHGVRPSVRTCVPLPAINTNPAEILTRVATLIERGLRRPGKRIWIPLAIALTKIDAVLDGFDRQSAVHKTARHSGGFDREDFEQLTSDISSQLVKWDLRSLTNEAKIRFENVGYFAVSALGESPDGSGNLKRIRPHRLEDPFLWLLYENGFLKERRP